MSSPSSATVILVLILLASSCLQANEEIEALISQLDRGNSASERVSSANALRAMENRAALNAVESLAKNCADDNSDVRGAAVLALGNLQHRFKRPCHHSLVQAMFDQDSTIRANASGYVELMAKRLPDEGAALLLRHAAHRQPLIRMSVLRTLAVSGRDDPIIRAVLRQAVHDRHAMIRNNAVVQLFNTTGDLSAAVPHWLLLLDEPGNAGADDVESNGLEFIKIGVAQRFHNLGKTKPNEIIPVLISSLDDDSPVVRGAAARILGAVANDSDDAARLSAKLCARQAVKPLLNDRVESVRANAAIGLARLPK